MQTKKASAPLKVTRRTVSDSPRCLGEPTSLFPYKIAQIVCRTTITDFV